MCMGTYKGNNGSNYIFSVTSYRYTTQVQRVRDIKDNGMIVHSLNYDSSL